MENSRQHTNNHVLQDGSLSARVISFKVEEVGFIVLAEEQGDIEGVNICCNSRQVHSTLTRTEFHSEGCIRLVHLLSIT